jgi:hypothetical protein
MRITDILLAGKVRVLQAVRNRRPIAILRIGSGSECVYLLGSYQVDICVYRALHGAGKGCGWPFLWVILKHHSAKASRTVYTILRSVYSSQSASTLAWFVSPSSIRVQNGSNYTCSQTNLVSRPTAEVRTAQNATSFSPLTRPFSKPNYQQKKCA